MALSFSFRLGVSRLRLRLRPSLSLSPKKASAFITPTKSCSYECHEVKSMLQQKHYSTSQSMKSRYEYIETKIPKVYDILCEDMKLIPDFLTEDEEEQMLQESLKYMKRLRYEFNHWDNAIHGYREIERKNWSELNSQIIKKVQKLAFAQQDCTLAYVHILDLARDGYIKPHIDAIRFCGDTIAGMSLMSSSVMRLSQENDKSMCGNVYLPQRSLYIMKNRARYDFTHEVLKDEESFFNGKHIPRKRRISIVCRNEPRPEDCD